MASAGWGAAAQGLTDMGNVFAAHHAAKDQQRRQESMYRMRYRWAVKDLEKAGLNKILAVGGMSQPVASAQAVKPDIRGGYAQAAQAAASARQIRKQTGDLLDAQIEKTRNEAKESGFGAEVGRYKAKLARLTWPQEARIMESTALRAFQEAIQSSYSAQMTSTQLNRALAELVAKEKFADVDRSPEGQLSLYLGRLISNLFQGLNVGAGFSFRGGKGTTINKTYNTLRR